VAADLIREQCCVRPPRSAARRGGRRGAMGRAAQRRVYIGATIYVERDSQKGIIIGKGGAMLKKIGAAARHEIEHLTGSTVYVECGSRCAKSGARRRRLARDGIHGTWSVECGVWREEMSLTFHALRSTVISRVRSIRRLTGSRQGCLCQARAIRGAADIDFWCLPCEPGTGCGLHLVEPARRSLLPAPRCSLQSRPRSYGAQTAGRVLLISNQRGQSLAW